jgi:Zn-finger nucleic acid-binding protein
MLSLRRTIRAVKSVRPFRARKPLRIGGLRARILRELQRMKCPACFKELTAFQLRNLTVDVCQGGCGGVWFDAFELQKVDEECETAGEPLLNFQRDEHLTVDKSRKRECPCCPGVKLRRHFFSAQRRVEVDECPGCGGYWLDAGELALIRAEKSQALAAAQARQCSISIDVIRYVYRLRTEHQRAQPRAPAQFIAVPPGPTPRI